MDEEKGPSPRQISELLKSVRRLKKAWNMENPPSRSDGALGFGNGHWFMTLHVTDEATAEILKSLMRDAISYGHDKNYWSSCPKNGPQGIESYCDVRATSQQIGDYRIHVPLSQRAFPEIIKGVDYKYRIVKRIPDRESGSHSR